MSKCVIAGCECPKTGDMKAKKFCPAWHENGVVWRNVASGEELIVHCSFQAHMQSVVENIKSNDGVAASMNDMRNQIIERQDRLAIAIDKQQKPAAKLLGEASHVLTLENKNGG